MKFEEDKSIGGVGEKIGFVFSYFIFTTILFFILKFTKKLPQAWTYLHIMAITLAIALAGILLKRLLK
ncbi:hypothetical protein HYX02_01205 [Candidatus Woesearchaeota archaeon]|nr:hypothetical protein [Candidatus Woesearchaeota archaeon]